MPILKATREKDRSMLNFKVTPREKELIQKKADEYCGGNVSEWLRYSAVMYVPSPEELVTDEKRVD